MYDMRIDPDTAPLPSKSSARKLIAKPQDTDFMPFGNCTNTPPGQMFPSDGVGVDAARRICIDCSVKSECLEYALANRIDHGVWGGTSERERRRISKNRARLRLIQNPQSYT